MRPSRASFLISHPRSRVKARSQQHNLVVALLAARTRIPMPATRSRKKSPAKEEEKSSEVAGFLLSLKKGTSRSTTPEVVGAPSSAEDPLPAAQGDETNMKETEANQVEEKDPANKEGEVQKTEETSGAEKREEEMGAEEHKIEEKLAANPAAEGKEEEKKPAPAAAGVDKVEELKADEDIPAPPEDMPTAPAPAAATAAEVPIPVVAAAAAAEPHPILAAPPTAAAAIEGFPASQEAVVAAAAAAAAAAAVESTTTDPSLEQHALAATAPTSVAPPPSAASIPEPNLNFEQLIAGSEVVFMKDRDLIPDALFVAIGQMKPAKLTQSDRVGCYKTRDIGFLGLCCKHCGGQPGFGRYFPNSVRSLAQTTTSQTMLKHISSKCRFCDPVVRKAVNQLIQIQAAKDGLVAGRPRYGSRKIFFQRVWSRLHGGGSEEAEEGAAAGSTVNKTNNNVNHTATSIPAADELAHLHDEVAAAVAAEAEKISSETQAAAAAPEAAHDDNDDNSNNKRKADDAALGGALPESDDKKHKADDDFERVEV